jgi:hypothetical protein
MKNDQANQNETTKPQHASAVDDAILDRLVDGDLPEGDRRSLLVALDASADGWKRCALAFLEAQAWRQAMSTAPALAAAAAGRGRLTADAAAQLGERRPLRARLMLAAVIALVFGIGAVVGMSWNPAPGAGAGKEFVNHPVTPIPSANQHDRVAPANDSAPATPESERMVGVSVPLLPSKAGSQNEVSATAPQVPAYVLAQLQRQGYELTRDRKLVSVALDDGRQVTIPVDTIRWQYVGQATH